MSASAFRTGLSRISRVASLLEDPPDSRMRPRSMVRRIGYRERPEDIDRRNLVAEIVWTVLFDHGTGSIDPSW